MLLTKPSPIEFFSKNRFIYEFLMSTEDLNLNSLSNFLMMDVTQLRKKLKKFTKHWFRRVSNTNLKDLKSIASKIDPNQLFEAPIAYNLYKQSIQKNQYLGVMEVELLLQSEETSPIYQFDSHNLLKSRVFPKIDLTSINIFLDNKNLYGSDILSDVKFNQFDYLINCYNNLPDCIKSLTGDERFLLNNELSIAYLYGVVNIPSPYISSPHLHGVFNLTSRKPNT